MTGWRSPAFGAGAIVLSAIGGLGCPPKTDDEELPDGKVTSIEAAPGEIQVAPGPTPSAGTREFRVFAWYRDGDSIVPGRNDPKEWKLSGAGGDANQDKVTINTFPASGSQPADVRISKQGDDKVADKVTLTVWADASAAKALGDVVEAPHQPASVPSAVLLEKKAPDGTCEWGTPRAFVGAAAVDEQSDNPCSLALFSGKMGVVFQDNRWGDQWAPAAWAAKGASFPLKPDTLLELRVDVFLAVSPSLIASATSTAQSTPGPADDFAVEPEKLARNDVDWANVLYQDNGVGVRINAQYHPVSTSGDLSAFVGADPYDCVIPPTLPSDPTKTDYAYEPAAVSVYYVDRINFPPDPSYPSVRGIQCHYWYSGNPAGTPPGKGPVIFISYSHHSPVTLAHELGHALGLNDEEGRLGRLNIMHNLLPDGPLGADARSRFKVGQAFRMNVWNDSWINTRLPRPPHRTCDDAQHCPPMGWDVP